MDYMEISAYNPEHQRGIRVFLDGKDVSNEIFWAYAPAVAGVEAEGRVKGYYMPSRKLADGTIAEWCKTGKVYWIRKEVS